MDAQDLEKLNALDFYIAGYDKTIAELKRLPAPPSLALLHLEYVNLLTGQADAVRKMAGAKSDPVNSIVGIKQYLEVQQRIGALFQKFLKEFDKAGA